MPRTVQTYTVPLQGNIIDWDSFEGDGTVGASIIPDVVKDWSTVGVPDDEKEVITYLKSINIDEGSCVVDVVAHPSFHGFMNALLAGRSIEQLVADRGIAHLKIPDGVGRPQKDLEFNRDIEIGP